MLVRRSLLFVWRSVKYPDLDPRHLDPHQEVTTNRAKRDEYGTKLDPLVADRLSLSHAILPTSPRQPDPLRRNKHHWHLPLQKTLDESCWTDTTMYLPPLIARILPLFADSSPSASTTTSASAVSSVKTFRPIKAHYNQPDTPTLLWHDASESHKLQDIRAFDLDAGDAIHALDNGESIDPPPLVLRTRRIPIMRPRYLPSTSSLRNLTFSQRSSLLSAAPDWEETEVEAPDTTDRETLRTLAMMSSNAYIEPNSTEWYTLEKWNVVSNNASYRLQRENLTRDSQSTPFGWEKDADGLRGHIVRSLCWHFLMSR
jgi:hypothetical protein